MKLFTVKEAANYLNISMPTLRKLVNEEKISYVDLGSGRYRVIRFKQEHIEDYLTRNEIKAS